MLPVFDGHNDALTCEDHGDLARGRGGGHLDDADTPLSLIAQHARYVADRIGPEHVALGSDFDGATIPAELSDAAGLPRLLGALEDAGFGEEELKALCWENWRRVLEAWWH